MKQSSRDEQDSHFPPSSHPVFQGIGEQEERTGYYRPPASRFRSSDDWRRINRERFSRWDGSWGGYRGYPDEDEFKDGENSRILAQVIGSALLVLLIYGIFHSAHPYAQRAQQVVKDVILKESDFSAVTAWLQTHLGNGNLAFPVTAGGNSATGSETGANTSVEDQTFVDPLTDYKVTTEFDAAKYPAMLLQTQAGAKVQTVTKGKVKSVDKNDKYGVYVIVEHSSTVGQTLYGHLASVVVKPGDWLYTGQTVGTVAGQENPDLYFAYIKSDNKFSDPREVLKRVARE